MVTVSPPLVDLWPQILASLKGQMPAATFETWLRGSTARLDGEGLTVFVKNGHALDWLEHQLHPVIERTAGQFVPGVTVSYEVLQGEFELEIKGVYQDDYARIVKPDRVFVGTQYFRREWIPLLGPGRGLLIIALRQRCYWNRRTGERRDQCAATYAELAAEVGISERTAQRLLRPGALVDQFILDRKVIRRYSDQQRRVVNVSMRWVIRLDEPILTDELRRTIKADGR